MQLTQIRKDIDWVSTDFSNTSSNHVDALIICEMYAAYFESMRIDVFDCFCYVILKFRISAKFKGIQNSRRVPCIDIFKPEKLWRFPTQGRQENISIIFLYTSRAEKIIAIRSGLYFDAPQAVKEINSWPCKDMLSENEWKRKIQSKRCKFQNLPFENKSGQLKPLKWYSQKWCSGKMRRAEKSSNLSCFFGV